MEQSLELINSFLDRLFAFGPGWIYLAIFGAAFIENVIPPFPGDFFAITGGALSASGRLNIFLVFAAIYAGSIGSTMLVYYFGRGKGREFFLRKNYPFFSARDISRLEEWFQRRGALLLLFNRFVVGARAIITLVAGIGRYDAGRTYLFASISIIIFYGLLLFGSYIFVIEFEIIAQYFRLYERIVWPLIIAVGVGFVIYKIYRARKNVR